MAPPSRNAECPSYLWSVRLSDLEAALISFGDPEPAQDPRSFTFIGPAPASLNGSISRSAREPINDNRAQRMGHLRYRTFSDRTKKLSLGRHVYAKREQTPIEAA